MLLECNDLSFDVLDVPLHSLPNQCLRQNIIILGFVGLERFGSLQGAVLKRTQGILPRFELLHESVLFFRPVVILHCNNFIDTSQRHDIFIIPLVIQRLVGYKL